jgi:hypothetical protein
MKSATLVIAISLLSCLKAPAPTYPPITLTGGANFELLGSQFALGETVSTYASFIAAGPSDGDQVFFWNIDTQDLDPLVPTYSLALHQWDTVANLPLGQGFFYVRSGADSTITRAIWVPPAPTTWPLDPNCIFHPNPYINPPYTLCPNIYYCLSSQTPVVAGYGDLVGNPLAVPHNRTYVWHWSVPIQDFDLLYGYDSGALAWKRLDLTTSTFATASPSIALGEAAFVAWYQDPTPVVPVLQNVSVAGCCPPNVTLTLTFSQPVDAFSVQSAANYVIGPLVGLSQAGVITSATGGTVPPAPFTGTQPSATVVLNVKLQTRPGNTYTISAPGVTSLGGTPSSGTLNFTLPGCAGPCSSTANDTPATATALAANSTVCGSLSLAGPTPAIAVSTFPSTASAGAQAKDVWYTFEPAANASVTINTCGTPLSGCPKSALVLAVYKMNSVGWLLPNPGTWSTPASTCPSLTFAALKCVRYYIRVSGTDTGNLPGDFLLHLASASSLIGNDICTSAHSISANSSTPFNNLTADTTAGLSEPIVSDRWYVFQAPAAGGLATVETCTPVPDFNTALAVYSGCDAGTLGSPPIAYDAGGCGLGSTVTFPTTAGLFYRICVGGLSGAAVTTGCGTLRVSYPPPNIAPSGSSSYCKTYLISGAPNNIGWSWSLSAVGACNFSVTDLVAPGVSGTTALTIANAFKTRITSFGLSATTAAISSSLAKLKICTPCPSSTVVLKVGPFGVTPTCWVDGSSSCSFNPDITEIGDPDAPDTDCNNNGQADYVDIALGLSVDADGNGVPDECQACVGVAVTSGPDSTTVGLGGNASLQAQLAGNGPFSYQWEKSGVPIVGATAATLVLTNLTLDMAGDYDLLVTNACGDAASPSAILSVDARPNLSIAQAGANVVLSWTANAFHLQNNESLSNPAGWTNLAGASPVTVPISAQPLFFRLQQDE